MKTAAATETLTVRAITAAARAAAGSCPEMDADEMIKYLADVGTRASYGTMCLVYDALIASANLSKNAASDLEQNLPE